MGSTCSDARSNLPHILGYGPRTQHVSFQGQCSAQWVQREWATALNDLPLSYHHPRRAGRIPPRGDNSQDPFLAPSSLAPGHDASKYSLTDRANRNLSPSLLEPLASPQPSQVMLSFSGSNGCLDYLGNLHVMGEVHNDLPYNVDQVRVRNAF